MTVQISCSVEPKIISEFFFCRVRIKRPVVETNNWNRQINVSQLSRTWQAINPFVTIGVPAGIDHLLTWQLRTINVSMQLQWIAPRIYRAPFAGVTSVLLKWCNRIWVERLKNSHALGLGRGSWVYGVCVCLGGTRPCLKSRGRVHFQMHAFSPSTQTCLFISISVSYHRSAAPVRLLAVIIFNSFNVCSVSWGNPNLIFNLCL